MKINLKHGEVTEEVDVGEKGDLVLVRSKTGNKGHSIGRLEGVLRQGDRESLVFDGQSYGLGHYEVLGVRLPFLDKREKTALHARLIEGVIPGVDNIIAYLENHPDKRYRGHAELVRRIEEYKKSRQQFQGQ